MSIEHKVPLVGQLTTNLCWFAAFQMLEQWYNRVLPKRPTAFSATQLAFLRKKDWGVKPDKVPEFAKLLGLTIKTAKAETPAVETLLRTYGPIWYPGINVGFTPAGTHHVVVLRGVQRADLLINDPSPVGSGAARRIQAKTLFTQLQPLDGQFLVILANSKPDSAAIRQDLGLP